MSKYFCYFVIISPLETGMVLELKTLEFPWPKDVLCLYQVWLKLTHWFGRRSFLNFFNVFWYSLLFPFGKGRGPWFQQIWIVFTQACFVLIFPICSGEEDENVKKVTTTRTTPTTTTTMEKIRSEKLTWAFGADDLHMMKNYLAPA